MPFRAVHRRWSRLALATVLTVCAVPASASYVLFESGQVRPLAMSPDGSRLFAVNSPDNRLEIFTVSGAGLTKTASVEVGLEPVAVAARSNSEVWVVNHLSDSVSIVDVSATPPRVTRTLLVGDEPRDIVFAGPGGNRAFITTARRGQNVLTVAPLLTTEGTPRALVFVFDATNLGNTLEGVPETIVELFGDTPRALAVSPSGNTVYAAVFHSGNQTATVNEGVVCDDSNLSNNLVQGSCTVFGFTYPGGLPNPERDVHGDPRPETGLIVKFNPGDGEWQDELGRNWNNGVRFDLPDFDVFSIDATANPPVQIGIDDVQHAHVGTILFNMIANPSSGKVYVSNTEAINEVRFEGPGITGGTTVNGHLHEARITVLDGANVIPRPLNKHINYSVVPSDPGTAEASLATPVGLAVNSTGSTLYVAAFGSQKIGVFDTTKLENDTFTTQPQDGVDHVSLGGGGPTGVVLDETNDRLYVLTRFDNSVRVVNTNTLTEETGLRHALYNPESATITGGRPFLYDANLTSSNGEASCSSCHVFGDFDSLAWDLGNPDDEVLDNQNPILANVLMLDPDFHPMKGPMTTQSLRGMANHGPMHWRGDRNGSLDEPTSQPNGGNFDEDLAFKKFNPAFVGLIGRDTELTAGEMQAFTDFILTVTYPPNPIRDLDQSLTGSQQLGHDLYFGRITDVLFNCNGCHTLDPANGFFGGDGFSTFEGETQMFKVPHLRNVYTKIGMFGRPQDVDTGPQVRGFGVLHDGSIDTVFRFLGSSVFDLSNAEQRDLEQFVFAFDSNLAPIVGQQATLTATSNPAHVTRLDLLLARAALGECDVVADVNIAGEQRRGLRLPDNTFQLDRAAEPPVADAALRALVITPGQELTYTCVPPGSGQRIGLDRDEDGFFDHDEIDEGRDPADAADFPGSAAVAMRASVFKMRDDDRLPIDAEKSKLTFKSVPHAGQPSGVAVPAFDSLGDPTLGGAELSLYRAAGTTAAVIIPLPASRWTRTGSPAKPAYKYLDADRLDGPIKKVTLKNGRLTIVGKGAGLHELDAAPLGDMALRLTLGSTDGLCTAAPARAPAEKYDNTAKWQGERHAPPPPVCPLPPH